MKKRILAVASAGGHFSQLMLLRPAYGEHKVLYLTTLKGLGPHFGAVPCKVVPECNRNTPLRAGLAVILIGWQIALFRPHVVISTGALPGVIALALGRFLRARTVWVDSVANCEEVSSSGRLARRFADLRLSQWEAVADAEGLEYAGSLL